MAELARQPPDYERRKQQHAEGDDVVGVRDGELVEGLDEEVVEDEHAEHGGGERRHLAAADGNGEHGDQIETAETRRLSHRIEKRNQRRGKADPGQGLECRGGDAAK
jgi:hypothetical protein